MKTIEMGIFARRRIEAEIIKPIYDILLRDLGKEAAEKIIEEAITKHATSSAQQFAQNEPKGGKLARAHCVATFMDSGQCA